MKKTIYVYDNGAVINKVGAHLQVRVHDEFTYEEPFSNVDSIVMFEYAQITTQALGAAFEQGISIVYTTKSSRILGYAYPRTTDRPLLRIAQYAAVTNEDARTDFAKEIVAAKIQGQVNTLKAHRMEEKDDLKPLIGLVRDAADIPQIMGYEGAAAAAYFKAFAKCLKNMSFERRETHPAHDPVNALLNLTYTLALHRIDSTLAARGFDTSLGLLHANGTDRSALSFDMLEPLRGTLDRFAIRIINRREVAEGDFQHSENGCTLKKRGFQKYIAAFSRDIDVRPMTERMAERLKAAVLNEEVRFELTDLHGLL
jgi:CRISPR-associated endonuclease Cas1